MKCLSFSTDSRTRKASPETGVVSTSDSGGLDNGLRLVASEAVAKVGSGLLGPCIARSGLATTVACSAPRELTVSLAGHPRSTKTSSLLVPTATCGSRTYDES